MEGSHLEQKNRINRYSRIIQKQTGTIVRPYRADGYVNLLNKYGTSKDVTEHYRYVPEMQVEDTFLAEYYEGNGLFAKIIDTPAEEAIKHGFELEDVNDEKLVSFYTEALDDLGWDEIASDAIKWSRLFGGSLIVMLIDDGGRIEDPVNWNNVKSIDDLVLYDRSVVQPDLSSMYRYEAFDPCRVRGSTLGNPEYYHVYSKTGNFTVHESRCLVFKNGKVPEYTTNSNYQLWGLPEYIRIKNSIRDAEIAHGTAAKMLDRSIQAVYSMKDLSQLLATDEGEDVVLKRLQTIDMARGLMNSMVIDSEGESYDFRTFQFSGVRDVIDSTCNFLSALTSIPQTILFGRSPSGMNSTGESDLENYYNFVERIQKRMLKKNMKYLLSVIFQCGVTSGYIDEFPNVKIKFNPLWSLSDTEQANLEQTKTSTEMTRAQITQTYVDMGVIDPIEVRRKLAESDEYDVEKLLDDYEDDVNLFANMPDSPPGAQGGEQESGGMPEMTGMEENGAAAPDSMEIPQETTAEFPQETAETDSQIDVSDAEIELAETIEINNNLPDDIEHDSEHDVTEEELDVANAIQYNNEYGATEYEIEVAEDIQAHEQMVSEEELELAIGLEVNEHVDNHNGGVGVLVINNGKILVGNRTKCEVGCGLICGPGGHIEDGETPLEAAIRETKEEFSITPLELIDLGEAVSPENDHSHIYVCNVFNKGEFYSPDGEIENPRFMDINELEAIPDSLFKPFAYSLTLLRQLIRKENAEKNLNGKAKTLDFSSVCDIVSLRDFILNFASDEDDYVEPEEWVCTNPTREDDYPNHPGNPPEIGGSRAKGSFVSNFPKVMVQTNGHTMKSNPNYEQAKHGNLESARKLVKEVAKSEKIKQLVNAYPDAIVVPVNSSGEGHNQIPIAYAELFAEQGMKVNNDIQISEKANRTGKNQFYRLLSSNKINGKVESGKNYIIVDDVVTSGASINEYRKYIENNGGTVLAATSISSGGQGSNTVAPTKESIERAVNSKGKEWLDKFCHEIGAEEGIESMTNWQVNYIANTGKEKLESGLYEWKKSHV